MVSKHILKKPEALRLRKSGVSIKSIESKLGVPRSTLSGWLRGIELTAGQMEKLRENWKNGLAKSRPAAVRWHNHQKELRIAKAFQEAKSVFDNINTSDLIVLEVTLAMLYWGEGAKSGNRIALGNSNPKLLKFFLDGLVRVYNLPRNGVRCALHLRADQNVDEMKNFWSSALEVPMDSFKEVYFDRRTKGSPTWVGYHGVCTLMYYNSHYWRRLLAFVPLFCQVDFQNMDR